MIACLLRHSTTANTVYPAIYANNKCVGMVWGDKVVDATWFGNTFVYAALLLYVTSLTLFL